MIKKMIKAQKASQTSSQLVPPRRTFSDLWSFWSRRSRTRSCVEWLTLWCSALAWMPMMCQRCWALGARIALRRPEAFEAFDQKDSLNNFKHVEKERRGTKRNERIPFCQFCQTTYVLACRKNRRHILLDASSYCDV